MLHTRNATIDDLSAIVDIYNSIVPLGTITADTEPATVESRAEWFAAHNPKRPLWIVEEEGKILGFLSFKSFYGRPAYNITVELGLYLSPSARGKGIGKMMLQKAIDDSPALGIENLLGFIFDSNETSIALFKHFGFEPWGTLPEVANVFGIPCTLIIMGRKV